MSAHADLLEESLRLEQDYGDNHEVKEHMLEVTQELVAADRILDAIARAVAVHGDEGLGANTRLRDVRQLLKTSGR